MNFVRWLTVLAGLFVSSSLPAASPLLQAHSHNDYEHERPLAEALSHGFWSVEADIWLTNGVLLVAHDFRDATREKTLQSLYLDPLRAFVKTNAAVHSSPPLTLLVDVKSAAEPTYAELSKVLARYSDILTRFESNTIRTNSVMVIISGERAEATMRAEPVRFAAVDGRLPDLEKNAAVALVPLISDNWTKHFKWRGTGPLPEDERVKLNALIARTHAQGRRIRLWATPDNPIGWKVLRDAGVDLINTDKLADLEKFLRAEGVVRQK